MDGCRRQSGEVHQEARVEIVSGFKFQVGERVSGFKFQVKREKERRRVVHSR